MQETQQDREHRREASERLSHEGRKYFDLIEFDTKEELVNEIRKHPFGLALILLTGIFVMLVLIAIATLAAGFDFDNFIGDGNLNSLRWLFSLILLLLALVAVALTFIAAFLYRSNVIFVTSEKIAQVLYINVFNRKISQLSIGDVQDVTVTQKGIFAHLFKYGTLVIETAGEQQNYTFTYVPDPYQNAKLIVGAHERNLELHGN